MEGGKERGESEGEGRRDVVEGGGKKEEELGEV